MRIHILGPSGSGTSTLGRLLSERLDLPLFDSDDFFWEETEVPYSSIRPVERRTDLINRIIDSNESWVISGAADGWGDKLLNTSDLIILLYTDPDERINRLKQREEKIFGKRILPGGDMFENHKAFLEWAGKYDTGGMEVRSRIKLESWVEKAEGKVLYFYNDEASTVCDLIVDLYS